MRLFLARIFKNMFSLCHYEIYKCTFMEENYNFTGLRLKESVQKEYFLNLLD